MNEKRLPPIQLTICHQRPDRSFFWKGKQFPVCARCTGTLAGLAILPFFSLKILSLSLIWALALHLPALIDGSTQAFGWRESNNWLRLATGIALGVGQVALIAMLGDYIIQKSGIINLFQ